MTSRKRYAETTATPVSLWVSHEKHGVAEVELDYGKLLISFKASKRVEAKLVSLLGSDVRFLWAIRSHQIKLVEVKPAPTTVQRIVRRRRKPTWATIPCSVHVGDVIKTDDQ